MSRSSLQAVRVIDSNDDDDDRADALWAIFMSVHRQGEAALVRWALELQSLVRHSKGNYLHALCWILNESRPRSARSFAETLGRRGIAIGPDSGHYENLAHLDPSATVPELPKVVGETPIGYWVDDFSHAGYDLSYRPERKGQLSRFVQLTYHDGTRLDIDIRLVSDNYDPAQNHSLGRMYIGLAGRLYPLRMDRLSTPRLWAAKHAALAEMRRFNKNFEAVVRISTSATMNTLPLGLAVRVQQPKPPARTTRPARLSASSQNQRGRVTPTSTKPAGSAPPQTARPGGDMGARQKSAPVSKAAAPTKSASAGTAKPAAASKEVVTGRVATRINLAKSKTRTTPPRPRSGKPVSAGWKHVVAGHFGRSITRSRSVFTISQQELRTLLQSKLVVQSPVTRMSGGQFVRTVDVGRTIETSNLNNGGGPTSILHVLTDEAGNLITAYPI